jgi:hypothetical protein
MAIGSLPQQGGMLDGYGMPRMPEYGQAPEQSPGMMHPMQPMPKKRGLFGNKRNIVGLIGDTLSIMGGGAPTFVPGQLQARQQAQEMQRAAQMAAEKRKADMDDFVSRETWKNQNDSAKDQLTRYMVAAGIDPASEAGQKYYRMAVENSANPIQGVPFSDEAGNSGIQFIRPGMQGGGMPQAQARRLQPGQKYVPEGGPTPQASGNFPKRL